MECLNEWQNETYQFVLMQQSPIRICQVWISYSFPGQVCGKHPSKTTMWHCTTEERIPTENLISSIMDVYKPVSIKFESGVSLNCTFILKRWRSFSQSLAGRTGWGYSQQDRTWSTSLIGKPSKFLTLTYWFSWMFRPFTRSTHAWVSKSIASMWMVSVVLTLLLDVLPVADSVCTFLEKIYKTPWVFHRFKYWNIRRNSSNLIVIGPNYLIVVERNESPTWIRL